jgi:hypothetical protein
MKKPDLAIDRGSNLLLIARGRRVNQSLRWRIGVVSNGFIVPMNKIMSFTARVIALDAFLVLLR